MGTHAQIDVRQGTKVVHVHVSMDGQPGAVLPALRAAARANRSTLRGMVTEILQEHPAASISEENHSDDSLSYRYLVDVSTKLWRVKQTQTPSLDLPTLPNGEIDCSKEALERASNSPELPAKVRYFRIAV